MTLIGSAGLEALSWRTAHRQLRAEAAAHDIDLGEYVAVSADPTPTTVFLEDTTALVGLGLALAALLLHLVTGSATWDGAASLLIGLLLLVVALVLVRRNGGLLIDEAAPADVREGLRRAVAQEPWVAEVAELPLCPVACPGEPGGQPADLDHGPRGPDGVGCPYAMGWPAARRRLPGGPEGTGPAMAGSAKDRVVYPLQKRVVNPSCCSRGGWASRLPATPSWRRRGGTPDRHGAPPSATGRTGRSSGWSPSAGAAPTGSRTSRRTRASGSRFAPRPALAGGPGRRTSATTTTRASGSGVSARATSHAVSACARRRQWARAR
jgi:hypothetical protein